MAKLVRPEACRGCPADLVAEGFVPPSGPPHAALLLVGQGPGAEEADAGRPFVGCAGQRLTRWCLAAGIDKPAARIANVVQCRLPGDRPPSAAEVAYCRAAHWGRELDTPRRVVVAVGVPAMVALGVGRTLDETGKWSRLAGPPSPGCPGAGGPGSTNSSERGTAEAPPGSGVGALSSGWAVGIAHPAAILRGKWGLDPFQIMHLRRVAAVLAGRDPELPDFERPAPRTNMWPTLGELREWAAGIGPLGVTIDVEAAGNVLLDVGLRRNDDLAAVQVGLRGDDCHLWVWCPRCRGLDSGCAHPQDDFGGVVAWLAGVLADESIPKAFQNGQAYDVPEQLENVGFVVRGFVWDTLLMAHIRLPEMLKGLEPLSGAFLGIAGWKALADVEGEGELK